MNTNWLEGMKCPECGSYEPFMIAIRTMAEVFDEGVEQSCDKEWDDTSYCRCVNCDHEGTVSDFQIHKGENE